MRAISLVSQVEFNFSGNIARNALTLGDVDNDEDIELVVGSENGEMVIFKGKEKWQKLEKLSFITCVAIGDILNIKQNCLIVVTVDGWCHIYYCPPKKKTTKEEDVDQVDGQVMSSASTDSDKKTIPELIVEQNKLKQIHVQRIPANTMDIVVGDIDGDGLTEIVFGLTDRVVRSYRWLGEDYKSSNLVSNLQAIYNSSGVLSGQLVGLNKWECANQIGSITLHHSLSEKPCLLVSQPGGTFMRIITEDPNCENIQDLNISEAKSKKLIESSVDYQFLGISRMRNQIVHTEILGDLNSKKFIPGKSSQDGPELGFARSKPYSLATLDGTIMLVQDEVILWAMAVDHQIFALDKVNIIEKNSDDVVASTWDGCTYILDQDRNVVRFQVGEPIQAFCCGRYSLNAGLPASTCLVYVTFKNKIRLYYDIPLTEMVTKKFQPVCEDPEISDVLINSDATFRRKFVEYVLYGLKI